MKKVRFVFKNQLDQKLHSSIVHLPERFDSEGTTLYAKRNVVKSFWLESSEGEPVQVVVKRYKRLSLWRSLIYTFFRSSKAKRSYHNASELRKRGFDTPPEIAYIETMKNGLLEYGYYITAFTGYPAIQEPLIDRPEFDKEMAKAFAAFAARLHKNGILHHDLNSTNVLCHTSEGELKFAVIDINRMKFYRPGKNIGLNACFDNLTRFTRRMDLFEYVLQCYIEYRGLSEEKLEKAIDIKNKHDIAWRRRKRFLRMFKG